MGCICYINAHHFDKFTGKALCVSLPVLCVCIQACACVYAQPKIALINSKAKPYIS